MVASGGGGLGNFDLHRIVQEVLGDAPDFRRHGRGEEQRLAGERNQLADALDVGNEAHVEHAVGFVDDQQFDAGEQQPAALGMVEQPARALRSARRRRASAWCPGRRTKRRRSAARR